MLLYSIIIVIGMAIIATLNCLFNPLYKGKWWLYIILVVGFTIAAILLDGLVAFVIRRMPEKWFLKDKGMFKASQKELIFYKKIFPNHHNLVLVLYLLKSALYFQYMMDLIL